MIFIVQNLCQIEIIVVPAHDVSAKLAEHLYPLVLPLYEKFNARESVKELVETVVRRLLERWKIN